MLYPGLRYTILVEGQPAASSLTWDQFMASSSGPLPLQEPVDIHKVTNHLISVADPDPGSGAFLHSWTQIWDPE